MGWLAYVLIPLAAGLAVYAYAVSALFTRGKLATLTPPKTVAAAVARGAMMPACGCTALAHARRIPPSQRAPFIVAAYALNPLLILAALLLAGWKPAVVILALGLVLAMVTRVTGEPTRTRLDDLLLRREAAPWKDATSYVKTYGLAGVALGAVATLLPAWLAVGALALLFMPPTRDVEADHGARFARAVRFALVAFAFLCGLVVWVV